LCSQTNQTASPNTAFIPCFAPLHWAFLGCFFAFP
jgi:hypothetical protein